MRAVEAVHDDKSLVEVQQRVVDAQRSSRRETRMTASRSLSFSRSLPVPN